MFQHTLFLLFVGCRKVEDDPRNQNSLGSTLAPSYPSIVASRGFSNMGNTCYLNAMLQVLVHAKRVRDSCDSFILPDTSDRLSLSENIHNNFALIVRRQWNVSKRFQNVPIRPVGFFELLTRVDQSLFRLGRQQDAHEALVSFLGALENARANSLPNLFKFETVSAMVCHGCSTLPEPKLTVENQVIIPIENNDNVYSIGWGLSQSLAPEYLEDVRCQGCEENPQFATRIHAISTHPKLLLVVVQRSDAFGSKIHTRILLDQKVLFGHEMYKLIGVVHHHGNSVNSGHYTADFYHLEDSSWYHADDSTVARIQNRKILSRTAYILLYELI